MKELRLSPVLIILVVFLLSGCAGSMSTLKKVGQSLKPWGDYGPLPSSQPGLTCPINRSEAVWARCFLLSGHFRDEKELFVFYPNNKRSFVEAPLKCFEIAPFKGVYLARVGNRRRSRFTTQALLLPYPADFTLVVFHQNFLQHLASRHWGKYEWQIEYVEMEILRFSTTGHPSAENYLGIYADKIIKLAKVDPYPKRRLSLHLTWHPAHAVVQHFGFR